MSLITGMELHILFRILLYCCIWAFVVAECGSGTFTEQFGFFHYSSKADGEDCNWSFRPPNAHGRFLFAMKLFRITHFEDKVIAFLPNASPLKDVARDHCMLFASPGVDQQFCLQAYNISGCSEEVLLERSWPPAFSSSTTQQADPTKVFGFELVYFFLDCHSDLLKLTDKDNVEDKPDDVRSNKVDNSLNLATLIAAAALGFLLLVAIFAIGCIVRKRKQVKPPHPHINIAHNHLVQTTSLSGDSIPLTNGCNANTYVYVDQAAVRGSTEADNSNVYSSIPAKQFVQNELYHGQGDV